MLSKETQGLIVSKKSYITSETVIVDVDDNGATFVLTFVRRTPTGTHYVGSMCREWAEDIPGSSRVEIPGEVGDHFKCPVGFLTVLRILYAFPTEQIEYKTPLAQAVFINQQMQFQLGAARADVNSAWQQRQEVPSHNLCVREGIELTAYQQVAAHLATLGTNFAFFMEQGTGKTPTAITAVNTWIRDSSKEFLRVLVVCPRNVIFNWITEFKSFGAHEVQIDSIRGGEVKRIGKLAKVLKPSASARAGVAVMNYDTVMAMEQLIGAIPWDIVIVDECHYIKGPQSQRTRYFLNTLREKAKHRLELTGTPIANTFMDLWSQLEFLYPGCSGFADFKSYRTFFAKLRKSQETGFEQIVGMQHTPVLQEVLLRNSFIIRKADAMPYLPSKTYRVEEVEMTETQRDVYRKVCTQLAIEINEDLEQAETASGGARSMLINNVLVKLLRLSQVTSGFVSWDPVVDIDGNVIRPRIIEAFPVNPKLDWCVNAINNHPKNEKVLIWSWSKQDMHALTTRLTEEGIDHVTFGGSDAERIEAERRFNCDPECRVFIGNPASGGTGLNLLGFDPKNPDDYDTDATMTVYFAQNWNAVHRAQSEDRNHRRGTRKPVDVVTLVCPETVDEDIHERVTNKRAAALEISDIRSLLSKIIGDLV